MVVASSQRNRIYLRRFATFQTQRAGAYQGVDRMADSASNLKRRRYGYSVFKCVLCQRRVTRWHNARVCWKPIPGAGNLHCKGVLVWIGNGEKRKPIPCSRCDGTGSVFVSHYSGRN